MKRGLDGHVLLHQTDGEKIWNLPGGRIRVSELSSDGLRREMLEETLPSPPLIPGPLKHLVETEVRT